MASVACSVFSAASASAPALSKQSSSASSAKKLLSATSVRIGRKVWGVVSPALYILYLGYMCVFVLVLCERTPNPYQCARCDVLLCNRDHSCLRGAAVLAPGLKGRVSEVGGAAVDALVPAANGLSCSLVAAAAAALCSGGGGICL